MESNKFQIQTVAGKIVVSNVSIEQEKNVPRITSSSADSNNAFTLQRQCLKTFDTFFESIESSILSMNLTQKNMDLVYGLCENLLLNTQILHNEYTTSSLGSLTTVMDYVISKLKSRNSQGKRLKAAKKNANFVEPIEKAIGLKWKSVVRTDEDIVDHQLVQTTFHYVSIVDTLRALFSNELFRNMYINYNENIKHACQANVYQDFCCGKVFDTLDIFESKLTIQLQMAIDDFETCDALKSKAGDNKLCGIYFQIRNIPECYRSRLNNIFLVALVKVDDIKQHDTSFDDVAKVILADLKELETKGITIQPEITIKAALIAICCDNLGANQVFGLTESFSSHFYCRFCETHKKDCQKEAVENVNSMRKIESYAYYLSVIKNNEDDLKSSKGIKKYCIFNELTNFEIFQNSSVDLLHDLTEGVVPFFVKRLFDFLIEKKILNFRELQAKIRDYNYGFLNRKYKPSKLKLTRANLNQSARQMYCLIIHLPFILFSHKKKIGKYWHAMQNLLQIMQIVYSVKIGECDIEKLQVVIEEYLTFLTNTLKVNLTPKHHFLCHYPGVIRKLGPLIYLSTMRYESKHKTFTDMGRLTNNFKNIPMSFGVKHQLCLSVQNDSFTDSIIKSKTVYNITKSKNYEHFSFILLFVDDHNRFEGLNFLFYNSNEFRTGLMIINEEKIYEILHVLYKTNEYFIICQPYKIMNYNLDFNSVEIEIENDFCNCQMFNIKLLKNKTTYAKVSACQKQFIIAETLNVLETCHHL